MEYKGLGIHGKEWEIKAIQPDQTKTDLKDLIPDSTYIVRVGRFLRRIFIAASTALRLRNLKT